MKQRRLRLKPVDEKRPAPRGYVGHDEVRVQYLQEEHWWGWKTIDEEIVPSHVMIALGTTGYDCSGWKSKFPHHAELWAKPA